MAATIGVEEAQSSFPDLLARVMAGEGVVIASQGKPVARLAPIGKDLPARVPGTEKGKIRITPDFDDPMPDFEKEFHGE